MYVTTSASCDRGAKCRRASAENIRDVGQAVVQKDEGQLCLSCRVQTQEHKHEYTARLKEALS